MSQVISYRLSTDEVLILRQRAMPGESDSQTAQRLMKELLGVSTPSTSGLSLDERIRDAVNNAVYNRLQLFKQELAALTIRMAAIESLAQSTLVDNPVDDNEDAVEDSVEVLLNQPSTVSTGVSTPGGQLQRQERPVDSFDGESLSLGVSALARRLGVGHPTIIKNRKKTNFAQWTKERDPDAIAWKYDRELKLFFPAT